MQWNNCVFKRVCKPICIYKQWRSGKSSNVNIRCQVLALSPNLIQLLVTAIIHHIHTRQYNCGNVEPSSPNPGASNLDLRRLPYLVIILMDSRGVYIIVLLPLALGTRSSCYNYSQMIWFPNSCVYWLDLGLKRFLEFSFNFLPVDHELVTGLVWL